jgi:D-psicose/D-tagatose/L-ribulose 3-epimerase
MRLSISNIAWDPSEDSYILELLRKFNIDAIDIVPGKYFNEPINVKQTDLDKIKNWWLDRGIEIIGMQALFFGTIGLNLFGSQHIQSLTLKHLEAICRIASGIGASRLVFGSPRNRDCTGLTQAQTESLAISFFRHLGDIALNHEKNGGGLMICLEPSHTDYGANFMTSSLETANLVRAINHKAIRMQLDTGALIMNNEKIDTVLYESADLIGHIHASEPNLSPLGDLDTDHNVMHNAISKYLPGYPVTIEMLPKKNSDHLAAIERALFFAAKHYRPALENQS